MTRRDELNVGGMAPDRLAAAVRRLGGPRKPRTLPRGWVGVQLKLRRRRRVESSALAAHRELCRWGLCPNFAETRGLCNTHDRRARRALAKPVES